MKTPLTAAEKTAEKEAVAQLKRLPRNIRYTVLHGRSHRVTFTRWFTDDKPIVKYFRSAVTALEYTNAEIENKRAMRALDMTGDEMSDARWAFTKIKKTGKSLRDVVQYYFDVGPGDREVKTFSYAAAQFLAGLKSAKKKDNYLANQAKNFRRIIAALGDLPLFSYTSQMLLDYLQNAPRAEAPEKPRAKDDAKGKKKKGPAAATTLSPHTVQSFYVSLNMLFGYAKDRDWVGTNPVVHHILKPIRDEVKHLKGRFQFYTPEECLRLLETADQYCPDLDLLGFYAIAIFGGARVEECRRLDWRAVDFQAGKIFLEPGVAAKNGGPRAVPMSPIMRAWLERVPNKTGKILDKLNCKSRIKLLHKYSGVRAQRNALRKSYSVAFYSLHPVASQADALRDIIGHDPNSKTTFNFYASMINVETAEAYFANYPKPLTAAEVASRETAAKERAITEFMRGQELAEARVFGKRAPVRKYTLAYHPDALAEVKAEEEEQEATAEAIRDRDLADTYGEEHY